MKRYEFSEVKIIGEKTKKIKEEVSNDEAKEIITILRDESFGNENQRKRLLNLLTSLFDISHKDARTFFKKLGNAMTSIGSEMINDEIPEEDYADEDSIKDEVIDDEIIDDENIIEEEDDQPYLFGEKTWKGVVK